MLQAVRNNWQQLGEAEAAWRRAVHLVADVFQNSWNLITSSGRRDREIVLAAVCQEQSLRSR